MMEKFSGYVSGTLVVKCAALFFESIMVVVKLVGIGR